MFQATLDDHLNLVAHVIEAFHGVANSNMTRKLLGKNYQKNVKELMSKHKGGTPMENLHNAMVDALRGLIGYTKNLRQFLTFNDDVATNKT